VVPGRYEQAPQTDEHKSGCGERLLVDVAAAGATRRRWREMRRLGQGAGQFRGLARVVLAVGFNVGGGAILAPPVAPDAGEARVLHKRTELGGLWVIDGSEVVAILEIPQPVVHLVA
jgi:hypothetical protein